MNKKLTSRVLPFLLDGEWHTLEEFWPHVLAGADPAKAVKRHLQSKVHAGRPGLSPRPPRPLEDQIAMGAKRICMETLAYLDRTGAAEIKYVHSVDDGSIQLTTRIRLANPGPHQVTTAIHGLRDLLLRGQVKVSVEYLGPPRESENTVTIPPNGDER